MFLLCWAGFLRKYHGLLQLDKWKVLRCLSVSGVSSTQKMQILRTKLALMRREYYQEEKNAKHCEEVFPRRDVKNRLGHHWKRGPEDVDLSFARGGRTAHKTPEHKGTRFPGMFFRFKPTNRAKSTKTKRKMPPSLQRQVQFNHIMIHWLDYMIKIIIWYLNVFDTFCMGMSPPKLNSFVALLFECCKNRRQRQR